MRKGLVIFISNYRELKPITTNICHSVTPSLRKLNLRNWVNQIIFFQFYNFLSMLKRSPLVFLLFIVLNFLSIFTSFMRMFKVCLPIFPRKIFTTKVLTALKNLLLEFLVPINSPLWQKLYSVTETFVLGRKCFNDKNFDL